MKKAKTAAKQKKVTTNARVRERKPRIVHSDELVATILDRVAKGEPLSKVCDQPDMPTRKSFFQWLAKDSAMVEAYKLAIEMRADLYAEEIVEIADDGTRDYKVAAATIRSAMDSGETVGFSRLLRNALNGGETSIDDFFAEILGGPRLLRGTDYTPQSIVDGKLKRIARGKKEYVEVPQHKSYIGSIQARTDSRISGLNYLAENPDIPTELIKQGLPGTYVDNKWIPGSWALREDLYGATGYANALENHANKLLTVLGEGEEYKSQIKVLEREKKQLEQTITSQQKRLASPKVRAMQARRDAIENEISNYKRSEFYSRAYLTEDLVDNYRTLPGIKSETKLANVFFLSSIFSPV